MRGLPVALVALLALPLAAQQTVEERLAEHKRLAALLKQFDDGPDSERIKAMKELATINDVDARNAIGHAISHGSERVRIAAAEAMSEVKFSFSVTHFKNGLTINAKNDKVTAAIIKGLGKLGMCEGIQVLTGMLTGRSKHGDAILKAILEIGCPEAVPSLQRAYETAEREAKKPDKIQDDRRLGGKNVLGNRNRNRRGGRDNPNKDKELAKLAPKIAGAIKKLGGTTERGFGPIVIDRRRWTSIYFCTQTLKEYELGPGEKWKCPNGPMGGRHKDHFLRHRP